MEYVPTREKSDGQAAPQSVRFHETVVFVRIVVPLCGTVIVGVAGSVAVHVVNETPVDVAVVMYVELTRYEHDSPEFTLRVPKVIE